MSLSQQFAPPPAHGHLLQLYKADEPALTTNVTRFLADGLLAGDGILVIATPQHRRGFTRRLRTLIPGFDPHAPNQPILFLDARATLQGFMIDHQPDWARFETTIVAHLQNLRSRSGNPGVRAYGEMVGILWNTGQKSAAIRLEHFWNELLTQTPCSLYCGYPIDIFDPEFLSSEVHELLCAHTHLIPVGHNGDLDTAMQRAAQEVFGPAPPSPAVLAASDTQRPLALLPKAEASLLSLRTEFPGHADQILSRARRHYQAEKRFRALVENSSDAISLIDRHGKVFYTTASIARVLGYEPQEVLGRDIFELLHPGDLARAENTLDEALAHPGSPVHTELRVRRKDGEWSWIESTTTNLLDQSNIRAIVLNYRDISERKAAEQEKQLQADRLARSNAELAAFAYAVTHDLKEPLRSVSVFTELLVQRTQVDAQSQELASYIVDGVQRMSTLLDDLLSFASLNSSVRRQVDLRRAADQAVKNLQKAICEAGAEITIDALPSIAGNPSHLMQLFQNLIGNALKYRGPEPVRIHVAADHLAAECVIKVKDNGLGIAPEYRERVFGLFKRLHGREVPGNGIGLSICKKIVEDLGGRIWVESNSPQGSAFCFTVSPLPRH